MGVPHVSAYGDVMWPHALTNNALFLHKSNPTTSLVNEGWKANDAAHITCIIEVPYIVLIKRGRLLAQCCCIMSGQLPLVFKIDIGLLS